MALALHIPQGESRKVGIGIAVLVILHTVGIVGMHISALEPLFRLLTPANLLVSTAVILIFHKDWHWRFGVAAVGVFLFGYGIEVVGVHTQAIFGTYTYGATLGWKVAEVPLLMGLNWFILIYGISKLIQRLQWSLWLKALLGAALMVAVDFLMEPVAVQFDFWTWAGGEIPLQNFVAWFIASFFLFLLVLKPFDGKRNPVAGALYIVQFLFFLGFAFIRLWNGN